MTLAERYIQRGRQEGEQNKCVGIAQKMLAKGFQNDLIEEVTGIGKDKLQELKKSQEEKSQN